MGSLGTEVPPTRIHLDPKVPKIAQFPNLSAPIATTGNKRAPPGLQAKAKKRRKGRIIRETEIKRKEREHGRCVAVTAHSEIPIFCSEQARPTQPAPGALSKCH